MSQEDLKNRVEKNFRTHEHDNPEKFLVRSILKEASDTLINATPEGRELSVALTHLEEAMFWATAGIGRTHG